VQTHTGQWYDHYSGKGGDVFHFLSQSQGISYGEAIDDVATRLGLTGRAWISPTSQNRQAFEQELHQKRELQQAQRQVAEEERLQVGRTKAQLLWASTQPLAGTLGEKYLRQHRGITGDLPEDLRFAPSNSERKNPALVSFARQKDGHLSGFQEVFLDGQTGAKASLALVKKSGGVIRGGNVTLQKGPQKEGVTLIAEGVETGLSLVSAGVKGEVVCTLGRGNVRGLSPSSKTLVLCADWDGEGAKTHARLLEDKAFFQEKGYDVHVVWPTQKGLEKCDFNDVLKKEGAGRVLEILKEQLPGKVVGRLKDDKTAALELLDGKVFEKQDKAWKKAMSDWAINKPEEARKFLEQEKYWLEAREERGHLRQEIELFKKEEKALSQMSPVEAHSKDRMTQNALQEKLKAKAGAWLKEDSSLAKIKAVNPEFAKHLESYAPQNHGHQKMMEPVSHEPIIHHHAPGLER
jgi:DNA primase